MSPPRLSDRDLEEMPAPIRNHVAKIRRALLDPLESDRLACALVGVLAKATNQETRRRALEKARRMVGTR